MKRPQTDTPRKSKEFTPPSGVRWMLRSFLPNAGGLYDELAKVGIIPQVSRRGRPRQSRRTLPVWAAIERDQHKRSMLEVGAMVKLWRARGLEDPEVAIAGARRSSPAEKADLKRLARRYVQKGRDVLAEQESEVDWPPRLNREHPIPPAILRRHFQDTIMRAVARWLADDARSSCDTNSPFYSILTQVLDEETATYDIVWLFEDV